jgi:hypothetical protein
MAVMKDVLMVDCLDQALVSMLVVLKEIEKAD